MLSLGYGKGQ